jgi:hypothetical protein
MQNNMAPSCYTCYPRPLGLEIARIYWDELCLRRLGPMRQAATLPATPAATSICGLSPRRGLGQVTGGSGQRTGGQGDVETRGQGAVSA